MCLRVLLSTTIKIHLAFGASNKAEGTFSSFAVLALPTFIFESRRGSV